MECQQYIFIAYFLFVHFFAYFFVVCQLLKLFDFLHKWQKFNLLYSDDKKHTNKHVFFRFEFLHSLLYIFRIWFISSIVNVTLPLDVWHSKIKCDVLECGNSMKFVFSLPCWLLYCLSLFAWLQCSIIRFEYSIIPVEFLQTHVPSCLV